MTSHDDAVIDPGSRGALRRLLIDFDTLPPAAGRATKALPVWFPIGRAVAPFAAIEGSEAGAPEPVSGVDASAHSTAAAVAAALAGAAAEHAADRAALETDFVERLAAERASWADREGAALASALRDGYGALEEMLAEATAVVLEPFLDDAARASAIAGLRSAIVSLTIGGSGAAIAVSGPQDLLEALRKALDAGGSDTQQMSFAVSDACEVTVVSDSSTIRTRLEDWTRTLQGCLGGQHE
jgi:hypothetical protein